MARYFADEQAEIDVLQARQDDGTQTLEDFIEEHAIEEGLLEEAMNDKGKELEERYANPVSELMQRVDTLSAKVDEHLKRMGFP